MINTKKVITFFLISMGITSITYSVAAEYDIDIGGQHASIQWKTSHQGFSMLTGRFNTFDGSFYWDENDPSSASVEITIDMTSSDSNHSVRDGHLQGPNYMNAAEHPTATFSSTSYEGDSQSGTLNGNLTMNGVTRSIALPINKIGEGSGMQMGMNVYKAGFEGNMIINPQDFNFERPATPVEIEINFEGNRR
ncbi:MAG: YceI family protein [Pseudomonadota bacterium]|nr:hypothetical protein [Gammaproteobacteria bacterium]MEE2683657.1 YceI family protein [Pseudomonadota bacterium]